MLKPCDASSIDSEETLKPEATPSALSDEEARMITDDEIHMRLVKPLSEGCFLTALFDTCHSGTVMDLPFEYNVYSGRVKHRGLLEALYFYLHLAEEDLKGLLGISNLSILPDEHEACVCAGKATCIAASKFSEVIHHFRTSTTTSGTSSLKNSWFHNAISHLTELADAVRGKDISHAEPLPITQDILLEEKYRLHCLHSMRARLLKLNRFRDERAAAATVVSTCFPGFA